MKKYEAKFEALQLKRKTEIQLVTVELQRLRDMISDLELKVHDKSAAITLTQVSKLFDSLKLA